MYYIQLKQFFSPAENVDSRTNVDLLLDIIVICSYKKKYIYFLMYIVHSGI